MKNIVYIDAQNAHKATEELWWLLDWKKFYMYLQKKFGPVQVKIFFGYMARYENLYKKIKDDGYEIVFKQVAEKADGSIKGNVDIDITMHVMEDLLLWRLVGAVVVTGDADFNSLISRLRDEGKLLRLIVPNNHKTSRYLRYAAGNNFQHFGQFRHIVEKQRDSC